MLLTPLFANCKRQPPGSDYTQFIDIESAMYRDRTLMINKFIDDNTANSIIAIILYLRNENTWWHDAPLIGHL